MPKNHKLTFFYAQIDIHIVFHYCPIKKSLWVFLAVIQLFALQICCFQKVTPPFQPSKREICTAFGTLFLLFVRFW